MAFQTIQMGLFDWNSPNDPYSYEQSSQNWQKINFHDHTPGRGVQLSANSFADHSVTGIKIALGTIEPDNLDISGDGNPWVFQNAVVNDALTSGAATIGSLDVEGNSQFENISIGNGYNLTGRWHYRSVSGSVTAEDGDFIVCPNSGVAKYITLPTPTPGANIAVMGGGLTTIEASPADIYLPDVLAPVSSYGLLGESGTNSIELISDGVHWYAISLNADSGWLTFPLDASWTAGSQAPRYRQIGNRVYLDGTCTANPVTSGAPMQVSLGALPAPLSTQSPMPTTVDNSVSLIVPALLYPDIGGHLTLLLIGTVPTGTARLSLTGLSYPLD